ncbi:MAG: BatD family protein, partial [Gallionellaceae bacterium]
MVSRFWLPLLLAGMLGSTQAVAEVRMAIYTDKQVMALGEALTVTLTVEGASDTVSGINLDKLKQDFNIYSISTAASRLHKKNRSINVETMTLILYPLHTGKLNIPALHYKDTHSNVRHVSVLAFNKQLTKVVFKTASDNAHPLVRQEVTLTLDIYDDGSLQWTAPHDIVAPGAHLRRLADSQNEEMLDGVRYTLHRYAWALMPLRDGKLNVEFPLLDAFKFGTRLRYPVAPLRIDVAAVPAYLPVNVPIGKPVVSVQELPVELALHRPVNWVLKIQGNGISAEGVRKLLSSVRSNAAVNFYPATVSSNDGVRAISAAQVLMVTLPFVPEQTGLHKMPDINLPYYDPASSRVDSLLVPGAYIRVFNPVWSVVAEVLSGLVLLLGIFGMSYLLQKTLRSGRKKRLLLHRISRATSAEELQRALLQFDTAFSSNLTLQEWLSSMLKNYSVDEQLSLLVQKLEQDLYGSEEHAVDITTLARTAAALLKSCAKNNRFPMRAWIKEALNNSSSPRRRTTVRNDLT